MNCRNFREIADSYLSDELLVETNHEVLRHLENCADCRNALTARRSLREKVRLAVKNSSQSQINPAFVARLRANLREEFARPNLLERLTAHWLIFAPTFAVLLLAFIFFAWRGNFNSNNTRIAQGNVNQIVEKTPESSLNATKIAYRELSEKARGDHENCALKANLLEHPISLKEAAEKYGKYNANIDKAVFEPLKKVFSDKIEFLEAHSCVFQGKRFAHVVLRYQNRIVSVVVTESENEPKTNAETDEDAITCQSTSDGMQLACFKTARHTIFVVSDLSESDNLMLARTISPSVRRHIAQS